MRAVVQRVRRGEVSVKGETVGAINRGFVVFLGVGQGDTEEDAEYLAEKIAHLRVFPDQEAKMNLSLMDVQGEVLAVSQFTLFGDCRKGRRPSFSQGAEPREAERLYQLFLSALTRIGVPVKTGIFQAEMLVCLENDGPVTMLLDSKKHF